MRVDEHVQRALYKDFEHENQTACCIKNDGSGCVQASRKECSVIKEICMFIDINSYDVSRILDSKKLTFCM